MPRKYGLEALMILCRSAVKDSFQSRVQPNALYSCLKFHLVLFSLHSFYVGYIGSIQAPGLQKTQKAHKKPPTLNPK